MKLFYSVNSPYARKCRVVALEKGLKDKIEFVQVDPWANPPELLAVNPLCRIPTLLTKSGMALCESPVICEYLDSLSPEPKLFPAHMAEKVSVLGLTALADGIMDDAVGWVIETMKRPADKQWPVWIKRKEDSILRTITLIAPHASSKDPLSMGTLALAVALAYAHFRLPHLDWRQKYSKLAEWLDNFEQRPSMANTRPVA
jgi:glutathione S-transferase